MRIYNPTIPNEISRENGEELDFTLAFDEPKNIFLYDGGVACCIWSAPRVFECHLLFPRSCRGRAAIEASKRMGDYMLKNHADMLWGQPPTADRSACWHTRQVGFQSIGNGVNPVVGPVTYFRRFR